MLPSLPVVCVVEDDAAVRNALKFSLEMEGLVVRAHGSAASLLNDLELTSCHCLVVDYRMPAMDGLELVGAVKARGITAPVIMITGQPSKDLRVRAGTLGILCVIEKPWPNGVLLKAIQIAIADGPLR
jgi:two-component system, LuxR family, response regulator FixJ